MQRKPSLDDTLALMRDLRARCEWDRAQTHESLRPYLIEEAHEVDEALRDGDDATLRSELGDLLLQVLFHSVVAEERGAFDLHDVAEALITKMRARHPHLYPREGADAPGARQGWEAMKARQRRTIDEGLPAGLPALHRAHLGELARGPLPRGAHGEPVYDARHAALEDELGDLLFSVVNLCRKAGVHASLALDRANAKFAGRFGAVERLAAERGIDVQTAGLEALDRLWDEVKAGAAPAP